MRVPYPAVRRVTQQARRRVIQQSFYIESAGNGRANDGYQRLLKRNFTICNHPHLLLSAEYRAERNTPKILNQYLQPLTLRKLNKLPPPITEGGACPEKTLAPQFESPNGLWQRLGYAVERGPRGARTIRRPDGSEVNIDRERGRHTGEIEAARQELERLPHGESACRVAQLDFFA
jgi:hypothetical protein